MAAGGFGTVTVNPYFRGGPPACEPYYGNSILVLNLDGSNGSTTIFNDSPWQNTVVFFGNGQLRTDPPVRVGTASAHLDGTGDGMYCATLPNSFTTANLCVEMLIYKMGNGAGSNSFLYDMRTTGGSAVQNNITLFINHSDNKVHLYVNGASRIISGNTISENTHYKITLARNSNVLKLFINDNQEGTYTDANSYTSTVCRIGADFANSNGFFGRIDCVRATDYFARYYTDNGIVNISPTWYAFSNLDCNIATSNTQTVSNTINVSMGVGLVNNQIIYPSSFGTPKVAVNVSVGEGMVNNQIIFPSSFGTPKTINVAISNTGKSMTITQNNHPSNLVSINIATPRNWETISNVTTDHLIALSLYP